MTDPLLVVNDLKVVFSTPRGDLNAVSGISFAVQQGQIYGIVGESGCGKTVTGRAILKLVPPPGRIAAGQILFRGEDLVQKSEAEMSRLRGRHISMVFQDPAAALNPLFTIGQQLTAIMKHHQMGSLDDIHKRAVGLLEDLGLPDPAHILETYPHRLSGGMQQRAMIALAHAAEPDLIVADEPTSALDVTIQTQILELLVWLRRERGVTIVLITHDLGVVAETCDEVAVFYLGLIVEKGPVREIFHHTSHPYTKGLLAALPNLKTLGSELLVIPGAIPSNLEPLPGCPFEPRCYARMPVCQTVIPPVVQIDTAHQVTCHLFTPLVRDGGPKSP
jgi:oligopeptide/dipeptide ABC transporter ATP-binding protein